MVSGDTPDPGKGLRPLHPYSYEWISDNALDNLASRTYHCVHRSCTGRVYPHRRGLKRILAACGSEREGEAGDTPDPGRGLRPLHPLKSTFIEYTPLDGKRERLHCCS